MAPTDTVDPAVIEGLLEKNDIKNVMEAFKKCKEKEVFDELLEFRYCKDTGTIFHAIARYSNFRSMRMILDYMIQTLGEDFFKFHMIENKDKSDRNFLIIACKHADSLSIDELLEKYKLDVSWHSHIIGYSALTYLIRRGKNELAFKVVSKMDTQLYSSTEKEWFKRDLNEFICNLPGDKVLSKSWLDGITVPFTKNSKKKGDCYTSKITGTQYIRERSFKACRQRQMLRHIATQLYFRFKQQFDLKDLEDVQLMHIERTRKSGDVAYQSFIFVALTPARYSDTIVPEFKTKSFQEMLLKIYKDAKDIEGTKRSVRFSKKIKSRIYGQDYTHTKKSKNIRDIIKHGPKKIQKVVPTTNGVKLPFFTFSENVSYLLYTSNNKALESCHAECLLSDIADYFRLSGSFEFSIYGKNRPCLSCCGRMEASNINYNKHPGFLSFKELEKINNKAATKTLRVMFEIPVFITRATVATKTGERIVTNYDYDTASDSEGE